MNADQFNALYNVGVPVFAYPGARPEDIPSAPRLVTRTRSKASVLGGHTDVVWVDGHSACIALSHVDVVTEAEYEAAKLADAVAAQGALPMPAGPGHQMRTIANTLAAAGLRFNMTGRKPADLYAYLADALVSAQLVQSPETAAELEKLRADRDANDREYEQMAARLAELATAAIEGRAALAALCHDLSDPGTNALGALYLLQQATFGTPMERGETVPKVFRASHDSIVMGHYLSNAEARKHCEVLTRRDIPGASLDWIEDEEDGVAELVAAFGEDERPTGYIVTALEIASEYDEEADE